MKFTKNGLMLALLCALFSGAAKAQSSKTDYDYLMTEAKSGEDALALLARYNLSKPSCNVSHFLAINELKNNRLKVGAAYKLPLFVVAYNGKSIRTTLNIEDWRTAKRIEEYNKKAHKDGLRPEYFIENKRLWVPWHEINCPEADTPKMAAGVALATEKEPERKRTRPLPKVVSGGEKDNNGDRIFPIFGPGYQKTPLLNRNMSGKVFYLISGHGGPDVGAQGKRAGHTLCEDEYAYDVTLRLLRLLISHGATAYMIV